MFTFAIANIIDRKYKILVTQDGLDRLDGLDRFLGNSKVYKGL
jgi:hypothetical protein